MTTIPWTAILALVEGLIPVAMRIVRAIEAGGECRVEGCPRMPPDIAPTFDGAMLELSELKDQGAAYAVGAALKKAERRLHGVQPKRPGK